MRARFGAPGVAYPAIESAGLNAISLPAGGVEFESQLPSTTTTHINF